MKTKVEITIAKRQRTTLHLRRTCILWCEGCARDVLMLSADEAAALMNTTTRNIFRRIEAGELHFLEIPGGGLFICCQSLENQS